MKEFLVFCLSLVLFAQIVFAIPGISIISPPSLVNQFESTDSDGIPFKIASYGKVPYGAHLTGAIVLVGPQNACSPVEEFNAGKFSFQQNAIAVATAGDCSHTVKTRNAQVAGAKVLVIVHNENELPSSFDVDSDSEDITIPTVLVPNSHGNKLVKFIKNLPFPPLNPEDIVPLVSINFPFDPVSRSVNLDFWFSAENPVSYDFIKSISFSASNSPDVFKFTPHFITWDCVICKRLDYEANLSGDCLSGGRYCAPDPDNEGPLAGSDIVFEDLRQACIWKTSQQTWWEYASSYPSKCLTDKKGQRGDQTPEQCSYAILSSIASPSEIEEVKKCTEKSFIPKPDGNLDKALCDNEILKAEKELQSLYDISDFPTLLINHKRYDEKLDDFAAVMLQICSKIKNPPKSCINRFAFF